MSDKYLTLTITTGRSGTLFLYNTLRENSTSKYIYHEMLHSGLSKPGAYFRSYAPSDQKFILTVPTISRLIKFYNSKLINGSIVDFGWTMSSLIPALYSYFGSRLKVISVVRHPISVAASFYTMGFYQEFNHSNFIIDPNSKNAKFKEYTNIWNDLNNFEKCLYRWYEITNYSFEIKEIYKDIDIMYVKSEDFFNNKELLKSIYNFAGFNIDKDIQLTRNLNALELKNIEVNPLKNNWREYKNHNSLIKFAQELGYDMDKNYISELVEKYKMPRGILSKLRYYSRYWQMRRVASIILRRTGLLKKKESKFSNQLHNPNFFDSL